MNTNFEPVMAALFAHLQAAASLPFTATAAENSAVLTGVSAEANLFPGLPVFGPGVPPQTTIAALDAAADTVTLSAPVTTTTPDAAFTTGFLTTGRRVIPWGQVDAQPALFLRRVGTSDDYGSDSFFSMTTLECEVWIYSQAGKDPNAVPDVALSNLDALIRQSLKGDSDYGDPRFTLGGLCYWCRIEGRSDYSPGDLSGQGLSRIPIRILLP